MTYKQWRHNPKSAKINSVHKIHQKYNINNHPSSLLCQRVRSYSYLGVRITEALTFSTHTDIGVRRARPPSITTSGSWRNSVSLRILMPFTLGCRELPDRNLTTGFVKFVRTWGLCREYCRIYTTGGAEQKPVGSWRTVSAAAIRPALPQSHSKNRLRESFFPCAIGTVISPGPPPSSTHWPSQWLHIYTSFTYFHISSDPLSISTPIANSG